MNKARIMKPPPSLHLPDGLNRRKYINIRSERVLLPHHLFRTANTFQRSSLKEHVRHMRKSDIWHVELHHTGLCCRGETENRGVIRHKKKKSKEKNSQKHENLLRRRAARRWKNGCGDKSEHRCLAVNQLSSGLFIYLFKRRQIPS